jgi:hypothetical protein
MSPTKTGWSRTFASQNPTEIQGVVVRARQTPRDAGDRPTPGSQERNLTPEQLARLPIDQSDLALLATLHPVSSASRPPTPRRPRFPSRAFAPTRTASPSTA